MLVPTSKSKWQSKCAKNILRYPDLHPFWLSRYYDFNVFSEKKYVEKLKYLHRNPVVRGLVDKPENWLWSSYRNYLFGEVGRVTVESSWTKGLRLGVMLPEF